MKRRKAFSLVEILVVMALISLLTAILVPALGRARGQADVIVCRARLRELFLASSLYAQENDARLPVDPAMLGPSHENSRSRNGGWIENSHRALMNLLLAQGGSDEIFYCPSWKDERLTFSSENVAAGEISYFYFSVEQAPENNGDISTFLYQPRPGDPMSYPRRLLTTMPGKTWLASDLWFSGRNENLPMAHRWYGKGVNYATLDGAVAMVKSGPRQTFK